jgi:hypothetical protein
MIAVFPFRATMVFPPSVCSSSITPYILIAHFIAEKNFAWINVLYDKM